MFPFHDVLFLASSVPTEGEEKPPVFIGLGMRPALFSSQNEKKRQKNDD